MRIVCPSCSAAYEVPDPMVRAGRLVRCARCSSEWIPVTGSEQKPMAAPAPPPPVPPPAPPAHQARLNQTVNPSAMDRLAAHPARPQRSILLRLAWIGSLLLLILVVSAAMVWRGQIVTAWPPSAHAFALLGLEPSR